MNNIIFVEINMFLITLNKFIKNVILTGKFQKTNLKLQKIISKKMSKLKNLSCIRTIYKNKQTKENKQKWKL